MPCKYLARYVIVETTYDAPEDDPATGAILEICEIEVYGNQSFRVDNQLPCEQFEINFS